MFEKFGEFGSAEELNAAAAGFKDEGDLESLFALAQENGIDKEDAQDYADGLTPELATVFQAAMGRLEIQKKEYVTNNTNVAERMACNVILTMLWAMCTTEQMAAAVMQKGKCAKEIYAIMGEEARKHMANQQAVSCGTDQELREIIKAYYTNPKGCRKKIAALYVFGN